MEVRPNLKYTTGDEWVRVEGNIATIGVSDYAQSQLSDIVYLEFKLDAGDLGQKRHILCDHGIGQSRRGREYTCYRARSLN